MSVIEWVPYQPLPGKEMEAYLDACKQVKILQNRINKIVSYLKEALNENKLPNGENADIGYWENQCEELLQISKGFKDD